MALAVLLEIFHKLNSVKPNVIENSISFAGESSPSSSENDNEEYLNSEQAAKLLAFPLKSFRNAVSMGRIPHYKLFGHNRFKKTELLKLLVRVEPKQLGRHLSAKFGEANTQCFNNHFAFGVWLRVTPKLIIQHLDGTFYVIRKNLFFAFIV
ncbi:MAG: helix-turn-helix domain-containing protein [Bdellovibrionales bacterium]|nr:helix-turn-helix domain-containing protein [Bdellovibrionales bacterium]